MGDKDYDAEVIALVKEASGKEPHRENTRLSIAFPMSLKVICT